MSGIRGMCKFQPASGNREDWGPAGAGADELGLATA